MVNYLASSEGALNEAYALGLHEVYARRDYELRWLFQEADHLRYIRYRLAAIGTRLHAALELGLTDELERAVVDLVDLKEGWVNRSRVRIEEHIHQAMLTAPLSSAFAESYIASHQFTVARDSWQKKGDEEALQKLDAARRRMHERQADLATAAAPKDQVRELSNRLAIAARCLTNEIATLLELLTPKCVALATTR